VVNNYNLMLFDELPRCNNYLNIIRIEKHFSKHPVALIMLVKHLLDVLQQIRVE